MLPSELSNNIEQFIGCVHRNEAHFTYIYVYHTNVFEADNVYKNPPLNVISPIFLFHSGAPLTTDARPEGVDWVPPPQTKILATPVKSYIIHIRGSVVVSMSI